MAINHALTQWISFTVHQSYMSDKYIFCKQLVHKATSMKKVSAFSTWFWISINWNLFSEIIFCKMQFILLVNSYIIMKFQWAVAISICSSQKIVPFSKATSLFGTINYMSKQSNLQYSKLAKSRLFQYCPYIYIYIYIYTQQIHRYIIYIHKYT